MAPQDANGKFQRCFPGESGTIILSRPGFTVTSKRYPLVAWIHHQVMIGHGTGGCNGHFAGLHDFPRIGTVHLTREQFCTKPAACAMGTFRSIQKVRSTHHIPMQKELRGHCCQTLGELAKSNYEWRAICHGMVNMQRCIKLFVKTRTPADKFAVGKRPAFHVG